MGFLDGLFGAKASNPSLVSAVEKYNADPTDDNLLDAWDKLLKAKLLLATTVEGEKSFRRIKNIREASSLPFNALTTEHGESLISVFTDNAAFEAAVPASTPAVLLTGEEAQILSMAKGFIGLVINPGGTPTAELKNWQHAVFIEKLSDANKLSAMASKFARNGSYADAEGVLKGAIVAAQKDPGGQHPFTAELNVDLAKAMRAQGKRIESEWVYKRALQIYEACPGHDLELANTSEALGLLCVELGKGSAAVPLLTRAVEVFQTVPGAKPDSIGRIYSTLAELKQNENQFEDAEQFFKQACISLEEKKHPDLISVLNKIAALYRQHERPRDAIVHYQRAIATFDSLKRGNERDVAVACHQAGELLCNEGNMKEGEPLLLRAAETYRRIAMTQEADAIESVINEAKAKLEAEEKAKQEALEKSQSNRPKFGAPGKKPADLPLLDFQSLKSNPKATYVGGAKPAQPAAKNPEDPEEEALLKMRDFLDSVDKDAPPAKVAPQSPSEPVSDEQSEAKVAEVFAAMDIDTSHSPPPAESPVVANEVSALSDLVLDDTPISSGDVIVDDSPISSGDIIIDETPVVDVGVDELFMAVSSSELKAIKVEPKVEAAKEQPPAPEPEPIKSVAEEPVLTWDDAPVAQPIQSQEPTLAQDHSSHQNLEDALSATTDGPALINGRPMSAAELLVAQAAAQVEADRAAAKGQAEPEKKGLFEKPIDGEISAVFNRSMLGDKLKSDRFDKPIADRSDDTDMHEGAETVDDLFAAPKKAAVPSLSDAPPKPEPLPKPTAQVKEDDGLFGGELDSSLNDAFNSILADPKAEAQKDRFDTPIGERKAEPAPDTSRFDTPISERKAEPALDTSRFDTPISERKSEAAPDTSRFDTPISERKTEAAADASRFDTPISERKTALDASRFDTPISERKPEVAPAAPAAFDRSRFDKPVHAGELESDAESGLFSDGLDNSLNDAFNSLLANKEEIAKPAAQAAKPAAAATPTPAAAPGPKPAAATTGGAKTPDELIKLLEQQIQQDPENSELWLRKGTALVQQQRLDEAIKVFDKVTSMTPNDPKAWYCKGSSLHLKNRFEDALYCFNHVLNLEKDNIKAMLRKAECLVKLGRGDQGMVIYDRILLLQPKFTAGWLSKARALLQARKLEDALNCYTQVLSFEPNNEEANKAKNLISSKLGAPAK